MKSVFGRYLFAHKQNSKEKHLLQLGISRAKPRRIFSFMISNNWKVSIKMLKTSAEISRCSYTTVSYSVYSSFANFIIVECVNIWPPFLLKRRRGFVPSRVQNITCLRIRGPHHGHLAKGEISCPCRLRMTLVSGFPTAYHMCQTCRHPQKASSVLPSLILNLIPKHFLIPDLFLVASNCTRSSQQVCSTSTKIAKLKLLNWKVCEKSNNFNVWTQASVLWSLFPWITQQDFSSQKERRNKRHKQLFLLVVGLTSMLAASRWPFASPTDHYVEEKQAFRCSGRISRALKDSSCPKIMCTSLG